MPIYTTLDFLRHGEPVGGKRYRGKTDDPLSEKGWAQMCAATAGTRPWMSIVSSPLTRCRVFAEWLSGVAAIPMSIDERLSEVGFGVWEGRTAEEINSEVPDAVFDFKCDPLGRRPEGAEPLADFSVRVSAAYEQIVSRHKGEHVLVVAHAGVIRMAISHVLGLAPDRAYHINVGSSGMARIRVEHKGAKRLDTLMWLSKGA